jgi:signal transduction histidine kinase/ActR/RegA family two-component response regulator
VPLRGLRTWLFLLVALAALPGFALLVREQFEEAERFEAEARATAEGLANAAAAVERSVLDEARGFASVLAELPSVRAHDARECSRLFRALSGRHGGFANFGAATLDGVVFCSGAGSAGIRIDDRAYFRRTVAARAPALGVYVVGRISALASIHVGAPSFDAEGGLAAVAYAAVDVRELATALSGLAVPPGATLTVLDGEGTVVASTDPEAWVGRTVMGTDLARALVDRRGSWHGPGLGADARLHAHVTVSVAGDAPDLVVVASLPRAPHLARARAAVLRTGIGYLLVLLAGLAAAWLVGRRVLIAPLERLTAAARRLSAGDAAARAGIRSDDEIGELARTFDAMAAAVEERGQLEEQLRQAQKMEAVGRLAGGVAHDFNNLLTGVLSIGHALAEGLPADHPLQPEVTDLIAAGRRAADLTRQLLAFGRKQVLAPRAIDVDEVVVGLGRLLERIIGESVRVETLLRAGGHVHADRAQLEQVVVNLVVNARDAMPRGGTLTIETSDVVLEGASDGFALPPGRYVRLSVADTGAGMDAETLSRAFEPFFTTKARGSGLGLATVHGIVKQSGGDVRVRSAPGRGARFEILLPRCDPAPAAAREEAAPAPLPARGERLLVVEDNPLVRASTCRTLAAAGYRVEEAASAEEAIRHARTAPPDLVVSDVMLPGLNGRELADRLHAERPGLAVLLVSGYAGDAVHADLGDGYLQKPFTPDALLGRVRALLDRAGPAGRAAHPS